MEKKKKILTRKNQSIILVVVALIAVYFTAIISTLDAFGTTVLPNQIGSVVLAVVIMSKNMYRMTNNKFYLMFTRNLLFYGIIAFTLIVPHTAKTHMVMEEIDQGNVVYAMAYLWTPVIAFFIISALVITSIKHIKPKKWMKIHKIIWAIVPFLIAHFILIYLNNPGRIDFAIFTFIYLIVFLQPFIALFTKSRQNHYKTYIRQILTLLITTVVMLIFFQFGSELLLALKIIIAVIPFIALVLLSKYFTYNFSKKVYVQAICYPLLFIIIPIIF